MRLRYIFLIAFLFSFLITPLIKKLAHRFGILDYPNERKIHATPTPRIGGVVIYLAVVAALACNMFISLKLALVLLAATIVFIFGLADDIKSLSATRRLVGQMIAATILICAGISIQVFPQNYIGLFLNYFLTMIWVVGVTNAFNYLDGVDGLACFLGISILACFGFIGFISDQFWLLNIIIAIGAAILGFVRYNFPHAKIFLGDGGSDFIGFLLAAVAIMGTWAEDGIVKVFVPVFILGVPIFDMCFTTFMRIKEGKVATVQQWLEYAGRDHFHHRLLNIGIRKLRVVFIIALVSVAFGISGIVLYNSERTDSYFMLAQAVAVCIVLGIVMVSGERANGKNNGKQV